MPSPDRRRVLAIGIDAAEPQALLKLMARGDLPCLRALRETGTWGRITSPADIGSGAVWPTFVTGTPPAVHQIHSFWVWQPAAMDVRPLAVERLTPFWASLTAGGCAAVLDVPFTPRLQVPGLIQVDEWGAHDQVRGNVYAWPPAVRRTMDEVNEVGGPHPFAPGRGSPEIPADARELSVLAAACRAGLGRHADLTLRIMADHAPDVLLAVFPELHRASHYLWHTIDPTDPTRERRRRDGDDLAAIFRELDQQIGRLVQAAGPETTILLFSLHGMRATQGIPNVLAPLLQRVGFARTLPWHARSASGRIRAALALVRRGAPSSLKRRFQKFARKSLVHRVVRQALLPAYDWSRTVAFPLPTDQHGYLRVNLAGRESRGIVARSEYETVCQRLEELLLGLKNEAGEPLVKAVLSMAAAHGGAPPDVLPDLIVHWEEAAGVPELRLMTPSLVCAAALVTQTGQHAPDGFFLLRPARGSTTECGDTVAATDLHRLILAAAS